MNHTLAIKQYSRSSADQEVPLPYELRPVSTLQLTMGYLMHEIMDLCETADVSNLCLFLLHKIMQHANCLGKYS